MFVGLKRAPASQAVYPCALPRRARAWDGEPPGSPINGAQSSKPVIFHFNCLHSNPAYTGITVSVIIPLKPASVNAGGVGNAVINGIERAGGGMSLRGALTSVSVFTDRFTPPAA